MKYITQSLCNTSFKKSLEENCAYIGRSKINDLNFHLRKLEKEEKLKSK